MRDIVIPFQHSINKDQELIYTLRSLEKNMDLEGCELFIVGHEPRCGLHGYTYLPKDQSVRSVDRDRNQLDKIMMATHFCSEEFYIVHDDNFLLCPIVGYYHQGDTWRAKPDTLYATVEHNTKLMFPGTYNYDVHSPHLVTIEGMIKVKQMNWNILGGYGIKTSYANLNKVDRFETVDCKIAAQWNESEIREMIKDHLFFSIGDNALKSDMIKVLNELYPKPSRWERWEM